jgi:hypothetical protein
MVAVLGGTRSQRTQEVIVSVIAEPHADVVSRLRTRLERERADLWRRLDAELILLEGPADQRHADRGVQSDSLWSRRSSVKQT